MFKIILVSLMLVGCGVEEQKAKAPELPAVDYGSYGVYVNEFLILASEAGIDMKNINTSKLRLIGTFDKSETKELEIDKYALGVCLKNRQYNIIKIQNTFGDYARMPVKKWVMFHELGHCLLNAEHTDSEKGSLMVSHVPYEAYVAKDDTLVIEATKEFMAQYLENERDTENKNETFVPIISR
jgi:hypothetical protein